MGTKTVVPVFTQISCPISATESHRQLHCGFYCAKAHLVIELDGGGHFENIQHQKDMRRTDTLRKYNLKVIRIPNNEIDNNFEDVCQYIDQIVKQSLPLSLL